MNQVASSPTSTDLATGRRRKDAVQAIALRLGELGSQMSFAPRDDGPLVAGAWLGGVHLMMALHRHSIYFRVDTTNPHIAPPPGVPSERPLMTGHLYPRGRDSYVPGASVSDLSVGGISIMSWRRGWEAQLFHAPVSDVTH